MRTGSAVRTAPVLAAVMLALAGCSDSTRVATLNDGAQVSGVKADATLQQDLARQGFPNATVICTKSIIVNVGPMVSCNLTRAGRHRTVTFTFKTLDGVILPSSVNAS